MTDRYRGPVEAGHWTPRYTAGQVWLVLASVLLVAALIAAAVNVLAALTFMLGIGLGTVYGLGA